MIKTWAFYRRSTDLQEFSIEDQRKACQQFAAEKGWAIVKEFTPQKGFASGLTIDRDPQFLEMIHAAEGTNHGASYLVVYDVSRFGRLNPEEKIYWEQRFKKEGKLQVIYVKDDFKNDNSMADGILKFLKHGEAREYSVKLSASTLRGCKTHAGLGHSCGGSAPYGYDRLLIDQTGQSVVIGTRSAQG
ncbi:MAG: recombinase family protein [Elusimicrobiota bacterium]